MGTREDAGEISEGEAMAHPRRNEIFRDVGSAPHEPDEEGFIDITRVPFAADAALLLCSDGLSDLVTAQAIRAAVEGNAADPRAAVQALIDAANQAGGKDNVSAVLVAGERFADAVRKQPAAAAAAPVRPGIYGAAVAKSGRRRGFGRLGAFAGRPAFLLYGAILGAAAFAAFGQNLLQALQTARGTVAAPSADVLRVGTGGFATIGQALAQAEAGQTVEVAPGTYHEALQLPAGVELVSLVPRAAVLPPPPGSGAPAVSAQGDRRPPGRSASRATPSPRSRSGCGSPTRRSRWRGWRSPAP